MKFRATLTCLLALLFALPASAAPTKLAQQGRVLDGAGAPAGDDHAPGHATGSHVVGNAGERGHVEPLAGLDVVAVAALDCAAPGEPAEQVDA